MLLKLWVFAALCAFVNGSRFAVRRTMPTNARTANINMKLMQKFEAYELSKDKCSELFDDKLSDDADFVFVFFIDNTPAAAIALEQGEAQTVQCRQLIHTDRMMSRYWKDFRSQLFSKFEDIEFMHLNDWEMRLLFSLSWPD